MECYSLLPAELILTFSIPERPWMTASTTVLLPSQQPPPSVFHGIVIQPHIPYIYFCQIPLGFILLIFDLPIPYWHEPIKNKNKNGIFEVVFGFQKWTSIFEFWRLSKTGCHFFPCFWFPIGTRNLRQKQKRHFCFCFWRPYWYDLMGLSMPIRIGKGTGLTFRHVSKPQPK